MIWHPDINWCERCGVEEVAIPAWSWFEGSFFSIDVCEECAEEIAAEAA